MKPILIVSLVKDGRPEAVEAVPEPAEDAPSDSDLLAEAADELVEAADADLEASELLPAEVPAELPQAASPRHSPTARNRDNAFFFIKFSS